MHPLSAFATDLDLYSPLALDYIIANYIDLTVLTYRPNTLSTLPTLIPGTDDLAMHQINVSLTSLLNN